jgi:hypothetical protein
MLPEPFTVTEVDRSRWQQEVREARDKGWFADEKFVSYAILYGMDAAVKAWSEKQEVPS